MYRGEALFFNHATKGNYEGSEIAHDFASLRTMYALCGKAKSNIQVSVTWTLMVAACALVADGEELMVRVSCELGACGLETNV